MSAPASPEITVLPDRLGAGQQRASCRPADTWQRAPLIPHSARSCVLKLHVELLQLLLTLLAGALLLDLRCRIACSRGVRQQIGTRLKRSLLIHLQLLLPQGLVELQLIDGLTLAALGRRVHRVALRLLHLELQLVLLLLSLKLKLLGGACTEIVGAPRRAGQDQQQRQHR